MRSFRKLTLITLLAVYILIAVGGVVRSTGSGMGCPDWPKCFGSWVPPGSVAELPPNYKEIYSAHRDKKNQKFARYLRAIGFNDTAEKILNDKSILQEADFNATKTRVEYFNRIVGVIIGLLIFAVFVASLQFRTTNRKLTIIAFLTFLLVGFQGWIGSIVVSTNLTAWTVTVHMFLAFVLVAMLIYLAERTNEERPSFYPSGAKGWLIACIAVLLVQTFLGTEVRAAIDRVAASLPREQWISGAMEKFSIHRAFSWIVVLVHVGLFIKLAKTTRVNAFLLSLFLLILGTLLTGVGMAYLAVPAYLQPVHLLFATLSFGVQFTLLFRIEKKENTVTANSFIV